jgi:hypothetical protein
MSRLTRTHLGAMILMASATVPALADEKDRLYDFTDAYYRQNGVNPEAITSRRVPTPPLATLDVPFFAYQRPADAPCLQRQREHRVLHRHGRAERPQLHQRRGGPEG